MKATAAFWGYNAIRFSGSSGVGASNSALGQSGNPTLSLTTTQDNSAIVVVIGDWSSVVDASPTWLTLNSKATVQTSWRPGNAASYGVYIGVFPDVGAAGAKTIGLANPTTGGLFTVAAIEVLGSPPAAPTYPSRSTWYSNISPRPSAALLGGLARVQGSDLLLGTVVSSGSGAVVLNSWDGSAWKATLSTSWDGSTWKSTAGSFWNGTGWV
jgi:hypothetical protein